MSATLGARCRLTVLMRLRAAAALLLLVLALPAAARAAARPHVSRVFCTNPASCPKEKGVLVRGYRATVAATHISGRARLSLARRGGGFVSVQGRLDRRHRLVVWVPASARTGWVHVLMPRARISNGVRLRVATIPPRPHPLRPASVGPPAATAFAGNGVWIWYLSRSNGGDPAAIAAQARAHGVSTIYVKSSDAASVWPQFSAAAVAALKAQGLRVCAWPFVYGSDPVGEARASATAIARGADCLVIDAESAYEGRYHAARIYMDDLRAAAGPTYPLGLASFPYVDYHPALPYSVFLGPGGADANLPQVYWKEIGTSVDAALAHTYATNLPYGRPIAPLGQVYDNPGAAAIERFRRLAAGYGAPGVSWWSWQSASPGAFDAVGAILPAAPLVPAAPSYPRLAAGSGGSAASRGDLVVWAQELLSGGGHPVPIDGDYGSRTARAVTAVQQAALIPATGALDDATWHVLLGFTPVVPRWGAPAPDASAGAAGAARARPSAPRSARLPARRDEIPGGPLSP